MYSTNIINSQSAQETEEVGMQFAKELQPGTIVLLYGELGSGKTTFVKGLAKGFSIQSRIISPTFTIIREHTLPQVIRNVQKLYHLDLYRLKDHLSIHDIGIDEIINNQDAIIIIEWPERIENLTGKKIRRVYFNFDGDSNRKITIN